MGLLAFVGFQCRLFLVIGSRLIQVREPESDLIAQKPLKMLKSVRSPQAENN